MKSDIPIKIIKDSINIFYEFVFHNFNNSIFDSSFPSTLKNADVIPVFINKDRTNVKNYRPVSILHNLSKVKCMNTSIIYSQYSQYGYVDSANALA